MHQLIHGLVYENSPKQALNTAKTSIIQPLVEHGPYDYAVTFDEPGNGVAGRDRWGNYPAAVEAGTETGQTLIERAWHGTLQEYEQGFDRIEEFLDQHDRTDYWNDEETHSEYALDFHRVGQFQGTSTFLYDQDGQGIRTRDHLENVQNHWIDQHKNSPYEHLNLYLIPADLHL